MSRLTCPALGRGRGAGLERFTGFIIGGTVVGGPDSEELRLLIHAIPGHRENKLRGDVTIMLLRWRPSRSKGAVRQAVARCGRGAIRVHR